MPELIGAATFLIFLAVLGVLLAGFWVFALVSGARWLVDKWTRGR
jgi:hypothetical protein